jgi:hypothetical protein
MKTFQRSVLFVAVVVFLGVMLLSFYSIQSKPSEQWPPVVPKCPDYWVYDDKLKKCVDEHNLSSCPPAAGEAHVAMDFDTPLFSDPCNKYKWARNCGVTWDGITYGVQNPCNPTTSLGT